MFCAGSPVRGVYSAAIKTVRAAGSHPRGGPRFGGRMPDIEILPQSQSKKQVQSDIPSDALRRKPKKQPSAEKPPAQKKPKKKWSIADLKHEPPKPVEIVLRG